MSKIFKLMEKKKIQMRWKIKKKCWVPATFQWAGSLQLEVEMPQI